MTCFLRDLRSLTSWKLLRFFSLCVCVVPRGASALVNRRGAGSKGRFRPKLFFLLRFCLIIFYAIEQTQPRKPFQKGGKFSLFAISVCVCVTWRRSGEPLFSEHSWKCTYFLVVLLLQPTKIIFLFLARWWGPSQCQAQISSTVGGMMKLAASLSCCCCCCWSPHTETEKNRSKTEKPVPRWRRRLLGAEKKTQKSLTSVKTDSAQGWAWMGWWQRSGAKWSGWIEKLGTKA